MDLLQSVDPTNSGLASTDPFRPSFFELAAQEQLSDLLKPALRYTLSVLAQRNPRYLLRIVNRFDEVYALLMWAVERHYLKTWGSSFAENFYGLRRRRRPGIATPRAKTASSARSTQKSTEALRPLDRYVSLFTLVGLPYLQSKLHDLWEREGGGVDDVVEGGGDLFGDEDEEQQSSIRRRFTDIDQDGGRHSSRITFLQSWLKICFRKGYPYMGAIWQLWLLAYNVRYLFDKTPFWRPWFRWMRMDVRRVGSDDYPPSAPLLPPNLPSPFTDPLGFTLGMIRSSPFIFFEALKYALPASIFFFKFLEWWYSPENARRRQRRGGNSSASGTTTSGGEGEEGEFNLAAPKIILPHGKGVIYDKAEGFKEVAISKTRLGIESIDKDESESIAKKGLLHNGCPICGTAPINNPTAFPTGYVCCYTCSFSYVEQHTRCPVTLQHVASTAELRRVLG
jgi:peroxin-12